jgi:hypothetical protein
LKNVLGKQAVADQKAADGEGGHAVVFSSLVEGFIGISAVYPAL